MLPSPVIFQCLPHPQTSPFFHLVPSIPALARVHSRDSGNPTPDGSENRSATSDAHAGVVVALGQDEAAAGDAFWALELPVCMLMRFHVSVFREGDERREGEERGKGKERNER